MNVKLKKQLIKNIKFNSIPLTVLSLLCEYQGRATYSLRGWPTHICIHARMHAHAHAHARTHARTHVPYAYRQVVGVLRVGLDVEVAQEQLAVAGPLSAAGGPPRARPLPHPGHVRRPLRHVDGGDGPAHRRGRRQRGDEGGGRAWPAADGEEARPVHGRTDVDPAHGRRSSSMVESKPSSIISPVTRCAATWRLEPELKLFLSNNVRMSTATEICTAQS